MLVTRPTAFPKTELDLMYLGRNFGIRLNNELLERSRQYAEAKKVSNRHYHIQRNADPDRTFWQDFYSKQSEFGGLDFLTISKDLLSIDASRIYTSGETWNFKDLLSLAFSQPLLIDTTIYPPYMKNWNCDIGEYIGVKSSPMDSNLSIEHGLSWMYNYCNKDGEGGQDIVFRTYPDDQKNKFFMFIGVEHERITAESMIYIVGIWRLDKLFRYGLILKEPILPRHKKTKKAVYESDLKRIQQSLLAGLPIIVG